VAWTGVDDPGPDPRYNAYFAYYGATRLDGTVNIINGVVSFPLPQIAIPVAQCNSLTNQTAHIGGMLCGMMDGSVRSVPVGMTQALWTSLLLPNDNKPTDFSQW
jgi:hypothetical protein